MAETALDSFMDAVSDTTDMNEEKLICPEFEAANGTIKEMKVTSGVIKNGDRAGQDWFGVTPIWLIDEQEAREHMQRDEVIVYGDMIFLTVKDGRIDKRDNPDLATMLAAFDLGGEDLSNRDLFGQFTGQAATVQVAHSFGNNNEPRANVVRYAPL